MPRVGVSGSAPANRFFTAPALSLGIELSVDAEISVGDLTWPESPRGLVVLLARSPHGQVAVYPVIESSGDRFIAPAEISDELANRAQVAALEVAKKTNHVGVLTVTLDHDLNVIQVFSGPHRAGLWTIDGARTNQFEQHLRAVLDLPLGDPSMSTPIAMTQIVYGGEKPDLFRPYLHLFARDPGLRVHLYGIEVKPEAEIGHVTVLGNSREELRDRADHAAGYLNGRIEE